ncbi:MAG: branched-chain amino acid ABC transporter ATP-binding protein [Bacillaceae bacterium G1]|nr:branched-chain amino acid ABC transporter ATP-binding protein [Bacillota bacterium]OJF18284.1 MAG: branched-chain amino acid ABC transporter ATP-binding protein [Bacillaceae bacterium G1]
MLEVENLAAGYGPMQVLHGMTFRVQEGQLVSLLGTNGAGKTTTLRTISGLLKTRSGRVRFLGEDITRASASDIVKAGLVQVPEGRKLFVDMTVMENLELGAYTPKARKNRKKNLEWVFELFPILKERQKQLVGSMSGGQQQMVAIARGLMAEPKLLIMDEPSIGLSPLLTKQVFDIIRTIKEQGVTVLLVEQNLDQALAMSDYAYVVEHGRVVMSGTGEELMKDENLKKAYLGM